MVSVIAKPLLCIGGKNKDLFDYQMTHNTLQKYLHRFPYIVETVFIFHIEAKCTILYSHATITLLSVSLQLY